MEKLTREIVFSPAYDKRPKYGIHGVDMRWYLKGDAGVVQFVVYTNWHLPSVDKSGWDKWMLEPIAADLGYHAKKQMYEGQTGRDDCNLLPGCTCYYDGGGLNAEPVLELLIREGGEAVWKRLEEFYADVFMEKVSGEDK